MTQKTFINSERGGPPKYRLTEICESLGVDLMTMLRMARYNEGFPSPAISFGVSYKRKGAKDVHQKSYYNKKEVIDWYKKVTAEASK